MTQLLLITQINGTITLFHNVGSHVYPELIMSIAIGCHGITKSSLRIMKQSSGWERNIVRCKQLVSLSLQYSQGM